MTGAHRTRGFDARGKDPIVAAKVRPPGLSAMYRPRLAATMARAWQYPCTLVVAPAGSGKTTATAQFAADAVASGRPVAWYWAEPADSEEQVLRHLASAFASATGQRLDAWPSIEAAVASMEAWAGGDVAIVVDDVHVLEGSEGEHVVERLIGYLPDHVHMLAVARRPPAVDLPRLRLLGRVYEVGPEDLRFRSWEAEELFRQHYADPLPSEQLAELLRRTDGWAAGLQMFRLATRNKAAAERKGVLGSLSERLVDLREYLDRNVFDGVDGELRRFLVRTSVLGRLTAAWCDELLQGTSSDRLLREAERRHGFVAVDRDSESLRYPAVLKDRLEEMLVEELGELEARELHRRAGQILEAGAALPEALRAYCRAEDWAAAEGLIDRSGERILGHLSESDPLPSTAAVSDAWVLLSRSRREVRAGAWTAAVHSYTAAESAFGSGPAAQICQRERQAIEPWLGRPAGRATEAGEQQVGTFAAWSQQLLRLVSGRGCDPTAVPGPAGAKVLEALSELAAGRLIAGLATLDEASGYGPEPGLAALVEVAGAVARTVCGTGSEEDVIRAAEAVERSGPAWLAGMVVALSGGRDDLESDIRAARLAAQVADNPWLAAVIRLIEGCCALGRPDRQAATVLEDVHGRFAALGAGLLQAWAGALLSAALCETDPAAARRVATATSALATGCGADGALALSMRVLAAVSGRADLGEGASRLEASGVLNLGALVDRIGGPIRGGRPGGRPEAADGGSRVDVTCLGGFAVTIDGISLDPGEVRPRARAVLQVLALHAGHPLHRDRLVADLWPDDLGSGHRKLQVALSAVRRLFDRAGPDIGRSCIRRDGDCYGLVAEAMWCDTDAFETAYREGHVAARAGRSEEAARNFDRALHLYRGDLLPEAGSAEWVLEPRQAFRLTAVRAAEELAACYAALGETFGVIDACGRGLHIDRYCDGLWRQLIETHERSGDHLHARRARRDYEEALAELDLSVAGPGA